MKLIAKLEETDPCDKDCDNQEADSEVEPSEPSTPAISPIVEEPSQNTPNIKHDLTNITIITPIIFESEICLDDSDTENDSSSSECSIILNIPNGNVLDWLAKIEANTVCLQKTETNTIKEAQVLNHEDSLEFVQEERVLTIYDIDTIDSVLPVSHEHQEEKLDQSNLNIKPIVPAFECTEIVTIGLKNPKFEPRLSSIEEEQEESKRLSTLSDDNYNYSILELELEIAEDYEMEYCEIENMVEHFKGSIGFAIMRNKIFDNCSFSLHSVYQKLLISKCKNDIHYRVPQYTIHYLYNNSMVFLG